MYNPLAKEHPAEEFKTYISHKADELGRQLAEPLAKAVGTTATAYAMLASPLIIASGLINGSDKPVELLDKTVVVPFNVLESLEGKLRDYFTRP